MPYNKSFIDQASSVKMPGYWPCSLFAFLWTSPALFYGRDDQWLQAQFFKMMEISSILH